MRKMKLFLAILLSVAIASCGGGGGGGDSGGGTTTYTLTVTKAGTGSGTVTSSEAGISCGGTCAAAYNSGASVTLTAAADSGSTFAGWSGGGCSGTGTCTVAINAATGVTATFNTGSAAATESYNFYTDKNGGLYAIDSSSPTTPQTVDTGVASDSITTIAYGSYDSTSKVLSGLHSHYLVYAKGGKIYRVNAVKGQSLAPIQVSSETGATTICDTDRDSDFMNPDNSIYIYQLPGTDGNCSTSDDVEKIITVGMSASTSPITITPKVRIAYTAVYDANLSITGLLVTENGVLKKCDVNLTSCSDLKTGVSSVDVIGSYMLQKTYLMIDNGLYVYDAGANTLSSSLYTFTSTSIGYGEADSSAFYFVDDTKILKLPHNSSNVVTFVTETVSINNDHLTLTDNSLVYQAPNDKTVKAVPKTGGAAITLASVSGASDDIWVWGSLSENYLYYQKTVSGVPSAGRILDDGTGGSEVSNAQWIGGSWNAALSLSLGSNGWSAGRFIRVDGCTATGCGGGTLKSFDLSTDLSTYINIGQLPTEFSSFYADGFGSGSNLIGAGYDSTNTLSDIFYLNVDTANSLVRITNTTVGEDLVY